MKKYKLCWIEKWDYIEDIPLSILKQYQFVWIIGFNGSLIEVKLMEEFEAVNSKSAWNHVSNNYDLDIFTLWEIKEDIQIGNEEGIFNN